MSRVNPPDPAAKSRGTEVGRIAGQRASMAQLLLVARLRVRNRRDLAADLLERALQVIIVTFSHWFHPRATVPPGVTHPPPQLPRRTRIPTNNKGPDAYRHD